ncbi:MAG: MarR family winged helix-turn-helix transcriptional regulator [Beijerinckiaceae bacterium]
MPKASDERLQATMRVWFRMARLHARLSGGVAARLRDIGLTIPQFDVLSSVDENEGMTQQQLAERLYVTKGNISGIIDRLTEQGLITRTAVASDKRSNALALTAKGRQVTRRAQDIHHGYMMQTMGALEPGQQQLLGDLLVTLRERVREVEAGIAPASGSSAVA